MSDAVELPPTPVIREDLRLANQAANQANAVTAITGLSGAGKSALADTAAEYAWEAFHKITLCYANDPGGFGTKRLALIRAGIMHVWDPRTHANFFETMELATLGGWPEKIDDPERGYADPAVKIILPRRLAYDVYCPQGHIARRFDDAVSMASHLQTTGVPCAQCGVVTNYTNLRKTEQVILRHPMFKNVGLRIYDSMSAINDQGLILELPTMSAKGKLATSSSGGSALGSANAFTQGSVTYGTGSEAQVGFMQNRSYGWLMNLRQLPEVVVPTIVTFGIEESKKDDESGGLQILGPRIAGKARTSAVPGWVGNLLYASLEPEDIPKGTATSPNMVFRLWLTTHVDPRDARKIPILAKHRGTPLGFDYLEDKFEADPVKRKANAWSTCSLANFFRLLDNQVKENVDALRAKFPDAPGFQPLSEQPAEGEQLPIVDEVVATVAPLSVAPGAASAAPQGAGGGAHGSGLGPASGPSGAPRQVGRRMAVAIRARDRT